MSSAGAGGPSGEEPPRIGGDAGTATLVAGTTFCLSASGGDVVPGGVQGLFVDDTRVVSGWRLRVDGAFVEPLAFLEGERFRRTFVGRAPPRGGRADATLLVERTRTVGDGMVEELVIRNLAAEAAGVTVELEVEADFADLFEVKESRVDSRPRVALEGEERALTFVLSSSPHRSRIRVVAEGEPATSGATFRHTVLVPERGTWTTRWVVGVALGRHDTLPDEASPEGEAARRIARWRLSAPVAETPQPGLETTLHTSSEDLGALQIGDPAHPDRRVVAAGAPWFMALFGRDSLLTSLMALPLDRELALGTLWMLADLQGVRVEPLTEEEPGRIVHEVRCGREGSLSRSGSSAYYGTVDATPLFVVLLGELHRWGMAEEELRALLPAADRAMAWVAQYGDRDGDGFVEYRRATDRGLVNQGWKDSFDGVTSAAGRIAEPPIALAEVQGYVYAAHCARAELAEAVDDPGTATEHRRRAEVLRARFDEHFWLPDLGWYATALDGAKRPVDALTSNIGHCLWSGIVPAERAACVAGHLVGETMWTGFGVRTLACDMGAYNPMGYHTGSVWPHDNALVAAGLMSYGHVAEAQQVASGILDAARAVGGRLPELFCGFDRDEFPAPVPYPTSCSPQAWAAAAPVSLLRTLLRFDPDLPSGWLGFEPALPSTMLPLRVGNLRLAGSRIVLEVDRGGWDVEGLPPQVTPTPTPPGVGDRTR
ncbi:MAG TPA: glycogen debranching N-terminal domain-containing protein [Actinomycetospora sp.]|uniref:amylo-alpha-1,6-glucosidase n=1 Tax=Actinomycetospora sp. TaxID=1872135 RepID=UPI002F428FA3